MNGWQLDFAMGGVGRDLKAEAMTVSAMTPLLFGKKKTRAWTHTDYFVHARAPPTRVEKFFILEAISRRAFWERRRE